MRVWLNKDEFMHDPKWLFSRSSLEVLVRMDQQVPGLLRKVLTGPTARAHAILLAVAVRQSDDPRNHSRGEAEFALACTEAGMKDLIEITLGCCPTGLRGVLQRLMAEAFPLETYLALARAFRSESRRAKVLLDIAGPLDLKTVSLVLTVDEVALSPSFIAAMSGRKAARSLNFFLRLLRQCSDASNEQIRQSLADGGAGDFPLSHLRRYLARLPYTHPIPDDHHFLKPLKTASDFEACGRSSRTCVARMVPLAGMAVMAYAELREGIGVLELRALQSGWVVSQFRGLGNRPVDEPVRVNTLAELTALGIHAPLVPPQETVQALADISLYDFVDFAGLQAEVPFWPEDMDIA